MRVIYVQTLQPVIGPNGSPPGQKRIEAKEVKAIAYHAEGVIYTIKARGPRNPERTFIIGRANIAHAEVAPEPAKPEPKKAAPKKSETGAGGVQ